MSPARCPELDPAGCARTSRQGSLVRTRGAYNWRRAGLPRTDAQGSRTAPQGTRAPKTAERPRTAPHGVRASTRGVSPRRPAMPGDRPARLPRTAWARDPHGSRAPPGRGARHGPTR
ncbi:hypothetical protein GCM10010515_65120 [Streptomyces fructofermentans]|uniref:Uncharacterized protein n=1 Tax=Streptomyces fructofermentans TaxID=152141 RepID=A0A918NR23_9ACTN|nr:hypothetical protein GCM10010515_65120 [Streptomyces fructofermentans]